MSKRASAQIIGKVHMKVPTKKKKALLWNKKTQCIAELTKKTLIIVSTYKGKKFILKKFNSFFLNFK